MVSYFARKDNYPGGLYFLLNIPVINVLAWVYTMVTFRSQRSADKSVSESIAHLKRRFANDGRNMAWKVLIILLSFVSMMYQLNRAGLRLDGPSQDGVMWILIPLLITFGLMLWYLFDKTSYLPILILLAANVVLVFAVRSENLLQPTLTTGIVNAVLYYGLFYFDELKWQVPPTISSEEE